MSGSCDEVDDGGQAGGRVGAEVVEECRQHLPKLTRWGRQVGEKIVRRLKRNSRNKERRSSKNKYIYKNECRQHLPELPRRRRQVRQGSSEQSQEACLLNQPPALR